MAFLQRIQVNLLLMLCNTQTGNMFIYFISIVFVGFGKQTISHNPDVANVSVDFRTASVRCCCAIPFAEWFSSFLLCIILLPVCIFILLLQTHFSNIAVGYRLVARGNSSWSSHKIRSTFLDYYTSRDHTYVASSSVFPRKDEGASFVNAGMNQVEKYLFLRYSGVQCHTYL